MKIKESLDQSKFPTKHLVSLPVVNFSILCLITISLSIPMYVTKSQISMSYNL